MNGEIDKYSVSVTYICGSMLNMASSLYLYNICIVCGKDNSLKEKEPVRCKDCGYRIFYKKRTTTPMQFDAR